MASRSQLLIVNTATSYLRVGVAFLVSMLLIPFILAKLGAEAYGLWALLFSVLGFFGLLDMGFATAVVKYVAETRGSGNVELRNRILSSVTLVYFILATLAAIAMVVLASRFSEVFAIPSSQKENLVAVLWLLALRAVILNLPLSIFRGLLFGEQRIYLINAVSIFSNVLYAGLVWWTLEQGGGLLALAWSSLIAMLLEHFLYVILSFLTVPKVRLSWHLVDMAVLRQVASFSGYQLMTDISSLVLLQVDLLLVQWFLGLESVALYAVALRISTHVFYLSKQFVNVLSPLVAEYKGKGRERPIRELLIKGTRVALVPGVIIFLCAQVFADQAIAFWVGSSFLLSAQVLRLLLFAVMLGLPYLVAANVLAMTGRHRFTAWTSMASVLANIAFSVLLVKPMGLLGIAWGTVLARLLVDWTCVVWRCCQEYRVGALEYVISALAPAVLPGIFAYAVLVGFREFLAPQQLVWLLVDCVVAAFVYGAFFWRYCLEKETKELLWSMR